MASSLKDCASLPLVMISVSFITLCKAILAEVKRVVLSVETPFNDKIISNLKSVPPGEFVPNIKNLDYFDELLQG